MARQCHKQRAHLEVRPTYNQTRGRRNEMDFDRTHSPEPIYQLHEIGPKWDIEGKQKPGNHMERDARVGIVTATQPYLSQQIFVHALEDVTFTKVSQVVGRTFSSLALHFLHNLSLFLPEQFIAEEVIHVHDLDGGNIVKV